MEAIQPSENVSTKKAHSASRILISLMFLLPSLYCSISQLFVPTVRTFLMSFQKVDFFGSEPVNVGLENYTYLFGDEGFWQAAGFTLLTLLVRLIVVALVPLFLAWAVSQFGRTVRLSLRVLLTLPVVFFTPVAIAIAWLILLNPANGLLPFESSWVASPASARSTLLLIDALYFFGLASGLGLIVFLPLWRRSADAPLPTFREVLKPMLTTWALGILGVTVLTLSTFTLNLVLTNGGPARSTTTLGILFYNLAFRNFDMGPAAAVASLILLVTLAAGILAGFLVVLTRLRLDIVDAEPTLEKPIQPIAPPRDRTLAGVLLALLALLTLGACLLSVLPFGWLVPQALGGDELSRLLEELSVGQVFFNSFSPPLIAATLQVLIAYLAALSIGALRPFGKRSEWLLLLFSPWLFIGGLPLSLVNFLAGQKAGRLDSLLGSISPLLFSVPVLFILTIFFAGRTSRLQRETAEQGSQEAPSFFKHFILPSLPLAVVLWLVLLFFNGQDILWPLLVTVSPERASLNLALFRLAGMFGGANGMLAAAITFFLLPVCVFFFICLALFQILYLDRVTLYAEDPSTREAA